MNAKNIKKVATSNILFQSTNQAKINLTDKTMFSSLLKLNNFFLVP